MFKVLYLVFPAFILSGCMEIPSKSDVPENISTLLTKVAAGITSRSEIADMK
jgi:hypothetical protein